MEIRAWQPGDEAAILGLFKTVFGKPMSEAFWRWRYQDHPAGGPLISLAWEGDRLAAHYAASQAPLLVDGAPTAAALSMTTMTHPDFRGQGLLERCATALYDRLADQGLAAVWGFPNRNVNVPRRQKLQWSAIADVPVMCCDLRSGTAPSRISLVETPAIDGRFTLGRTATPGIQADHRADILAWRIDRNPVNRYLILTLPGGDGLDGYAILKPYGETDYDLLTLEATDDKALPDLVAGILSAVVQRGGQRVNCWSLPQDPTRIPLERAGFQAVAPVTYFGGRALSRPDMQLGDARRWRIAMIDSDIY